MQDDGVGIKDLLYLLKGHNSKIVREDYNSNPHSTTLSSFFIRNGDAIRTYAKSFEDSDFFYRIENKISDILYRLAKSTERRREAQFILVRTQ